MPSGETAEKSISGEPKEHEMDFIEIVNGTIAAFECKAGNKINSTSIKSILSRLSEHSGDSCLP